MNNTKKLKLESLLDIAKAALKWSAPVALLWLLWIFLTGDIHVTVVFYCAVFLTYFAMSFVPALCFKRKRKKK